MGVRANHAQKIKTNERTGKNIEGRESEMITTATLIIIQALIVSWFVFTRPEPCPREYRTTRTHLLFEKCELDYGVKFVLKDEYKE